MSDCSADNTQGWGGFHARWRTAAWLLGVLVPMAVVHGQPAADGVVDLRAPGVPKPVGQVPSVRHGLDPSVPLIAAPPIDLDRVRDEDRQARQSGDRRLRIGVRQDLWVSPATAGRWDQLPGGGGRVWRCDIVSPDASGLRLHFMKPRLPVNAGLYVYPAADPSAFFGPLDNAAAGVQAGAGFWAPTCFGTDRIRIEYHDPAQKPGHATDSPFVIDAVQHIYRDPARQMETRGLGDRVGGCHGDVTCQSAWNSVALAVGGLGVVETGGQLLCTGQLLATTANDLTPYFLTANHCVGSPAAAASAEIYWRYQTSACNGAVPSLATLARSWPCTLVSSADQFSGTDYSLLMVEGALPGGLAWVGWVTAQPPTGSAAASVHHPDGSYKRIAFGSTVAGQVCGTGAFTRADWTSGSTEPGSSGAGLFRVSDRRLIGHLSCGFSGCVGASINGLDDDFGRFDLTYAAIGSQTLQAGSDDGFEPNDACASARPIAAGTYSDLIVKSGDEDWYSFMLSPGQSVSVALDFVHAHGDVDVQMFTTCGGSAVAQSVSTTNAEVMNWTNTGGAPRTVFIRVYLHSDTRNSYSLSLAVSGIANNTCANAPALAVNTPVTGTTAGATTDGSAGCGAPSLPNTAPDVWHAFTPPTSETYRFSTAGSAFDTVLSVHTSCPGTASNQIGCNDDAAAGDLTSRLDLPLTAGTTCYVRIAGYNQATGAYMLRVAQPFVPANDQCAGAVAVTDGFTQFSNVGATTDGPNEPAACNFFGDPGIAADVWFRYTATCDGIVEMDTCTGSGSFDTELAVYGENCPTLPGSVIVCNDDNPLVCGTGNFRSAVSFSATAGAAYLVRIGGFGGSTGTAWLSITCSPTGACCDGAGACSVSSEAACLGVWSSGEPCGPSSCAATAGACCEGASCRVVEAGVCIGPYTAFVGPSTACTPSTPCCRADFNRSGGEPSVQDIFDFLSAYFMGDPAADANDSGSVSVQDIFDFLAAYFEGC
ncbi:MAG: trypsin-like peptidase domain-containing protein [Phycisphaerales bacterium]